MTYIEFRCKSNIIEEVLTFYGKYGCVIFCVREDPGNNPHFHGLFKTDHKKKYLADSKNNKARHPELDDAMYKNQYNWKMNEVRDYDAYIRYMCKGETATNDGKRKGKRYFSHSRSDVCVKVNEILSQDDIRLHQDEFWKLYGIDKNDDNVGEVSVKIKTPTFNEKIIEEFDREKDLISELHKAHDELYKEDSYYFVALKIREWLMQRYACMNKDYDCDILGRKVNMLMNKYGGTQFRKWVCRRKDYRDHKW